MDHWYCLKQILKLIDDAVLTYSSSVLHHHFESFKELLELSMDWLLDCFDQQVCQLLGHQL